MFSSLSDSPEDDAPSDQALAPVSSMSVPYSQRTSIVPPDEMLPARRNLPLVRKAFLPVVRPSDDVVEDKGKKYRRRMLTYGLVSLFLFAVIYGFMEDPGGLMRSWTGKRTTLTWEGLGVYSSIVALVFFLVVLLLRYLALLSTLR